MIGPQCNEFWVMYPMNAFKGAPLCLGLWISQTCFDAILQALSFTGQDPLAYLDKFWEVREIIDAWGKNMKNVFSPGHVNCLDESMSILTNKFTCPGFMFIPRKPWPFGNEYQTVCCCRTGIMWGIELVEGKDHPTQLGKPKHDEMGSTVDFFRCWCPSSTWVWWSSLIVTEIYPR